ncbi:unnamed protein product [Rhizoctonia solani]|uniref:Zn(2)-C6 fungal-type domain-containing protein n=1 Tax=Rhizoctonia solani TaxID=456999 RepID=A0A8H3DLF8_9AGAM|nr:unnamed protein product [Rhizoctonia solani]
MLAYSLLTGALCSCHHKDHLTSSRPLYNNMSDPQSRTANTEIAIQRRTRRTQPYPSSSSILYQETREAGPSTSNSTTPTVELSSLLSPSVDDSSWTSSGSPTSSPNDETCAPPSSGNVLQRGSACLTCRRRKLKCDAVKPACTSCARSGRSQTCTYDDGLPKSRVQILTTKVRDLEAKIRAMEAARQLPSGDTSSLQVPAMFLCTNTFPGNANDNDTSVLHGPPLVLQPEAQKPPALGQNELMNLAASLAVADLAPLAHQRIELMGTLRQMTPWWELDEIPSGMQEHLISTFLARRWEPGLELDVPRLWSSLSQIDAHQPHKCFLNAIYLVACSFTGDKSLEELRPFFVARVRKELEAALVQGDRLIDFIRASLLLSFHYFANGRLLEGYQLSSTTARFAIACGMHHMDSARWHPQSEYGYIDTVEDTTHTYNGDTTQKISGEIHMLPRPRDNIERNEYIHAFWGVYMLDMSAALVTNLPSSVADSEITTPWPVPLDEVIPLGRQSDHTIVSFYSGVVGSANMSQDRHTQTVRVKSMCLLSRATRLSAAFESVRHPELSLWAKHDACDKAIAEASRSFPTGLEHIGPEASLLLASRATLLAAQIQLHACLAATRPISREKCITAAAESMELIDKLRYIMVPKGILLLLGLDWTVVKGFYLAEQSRLLADRNYFAAEDIEKKLQEIGSEMESVPAKFPAFMT